MPILLRGDADAFRHDKRIATATYDLTMIPAPAKNPFRLNVSFSPAWFSEAQVVGLPDMLPVIIK